MTDHIQSLSPDSPSEVNLGCQQMTGRCLHRLPFLEGGGQTAVRVSVEQLTSPECSISLSHVLEDALSFVLILSLSPATWWAPHMHLYGNEQAFQKKERCPGLLR